MEENNNKGLIILVCILSVLVLALGGFIVYDKVLSKSESDICDSSNIVNNCVKKSETSEVIGNIDICKVDSALENYLYDILGIGWDGDCLNYFLSNNNYMENAQKIFSLYAGHNNMYTDRSYYGNCNNECQKEYSCAECTSILKTDANKIIKLYKLNNLKFKELPGFDTDYVYVSGISAGVCHYGVTHDTSIKYIDNNSIRIIDKQVVTDYEFGEEKVNSNKSQTVTYDFEKNSDGNYYLKFVSTK